MRVEIPRINTRVALLLITSFCLLFLFAVRPIRLIEPLTEYGKSPSSFPQTPASQELIRVEHQKAVDEIRLWIQLQNDWFHYKFILVGAVVAVLVGFFKTKTEKDPNIQFKDILRSDASCSILAMACIVALAIDMHLRNNITVVQQLALWIANYAEPALLQTPVTFGSHGGFMPWEQFLRVQIHGSSGMHRDDLYGFAFYPYLHFLTWVIYVVYLWILFEAWRDPDHPDGQSLAIGGFILVQTALGIFTWLAHAAPSSFEFKLLPFLDIWVKGPECAGFYMLFWFAITAVNYPPLLDRLLNLGD